MKKIIKLEEKIFVHTKNLETAKKQLQEYLMKNQKITISEFKDLINSSRKYALPILVYFDSAGLTEREGDFRILKK
jgi:selenocysteine-specific elongation factor